ncbi:MAG: hypothetical protein OXG33_07700 [Chloroflexi bacterium]|nr:hypothetical protein [Chloroflexota bacterium]
MPLWDFVRGKNAQAIGYPISQRWVDGPFTLQAFQKVILQWDPGKQRMNYYNTLDVLADRYPDVELPFVPAHQVLEADRGADFATITRNHLALLEQNEAIKERFLSEPDWLNLYGLPIHYEEREVDGQAGAVQMLRAQRTVFVVWNIPAPGTTVGRVNLQNVPDKVKNLGNAIIPNAAKLPVTQNAVASLASFTLPEPTPSITGNAAIDQLDWVQDGVAESEAAAVEALVDLAMESQPLFETVMGKSWVQDGINADELTVVKELTIMAGKDEARALSVIQMPFLESVEAADDSAVDVLADFHHNSSLMSYLNLVLSHPTLSGGVRDEHVPSLTALLAVAYHADQEVRGYLYDTLLNPEAVIVEQRAVSLPLSGHVLLAVVRTIAGAATSMDWLERSVRSHEGFMGVPIPRNSVSLLVADLPRAAAGPGGVLSIRDRTLKPGWIIAHEAGHIYWTGQTGARWATEGGAEFMRWIALGKGPPLGEFTIGVDSCESVRNLAELEQESGSTIAFGSICHYRMGYAFFYDLYQFLGELEFRRGFRELYLATARESTKRECTGSGASLCFLRAGFVTSAPDPEVAARVWHVIHHWYYGPQGPPQ